MKGEAMQCAECQLWLCVECAELSECGHCGDIVCGECAHCHEQDHLNEQREAQEKEITDE